MADFVELEKDMHEETEEAIKELKEASENLFELSSQNADNILWLKETLKNLMDTLLNATENK